jgi:hypothetical protein
MAGRKPGSTERRPPGPKTLSARDWLFGSRPRRLLIQRAVGPAPPAAGWTKTQLAKAADVSPNGGVDAHVDALESLGLLETRKRRIHVPARRSDLADALARLLDLLAPLPDDKPLSRD